jgi:hypothetical protein
MTDLTDTQKRWLHDELGDTITDVELQSRFDELGSIRDVALRVLRDQRREWLDNPLSVSLSGVASSNATENVKALERRIAELARLDPDPSDPGDEAAGDAPAGWDVFPLARSRGR